MHKLLEALRLLKINLIKWSTLLITEGISMTILETLECKPMQTKVQDDSGVRKLEGISNCCVGMEAQESTS